MKSRLRSVLQSETVNKRKSVGKAKTRVKGKEARLSYFKCSQCLGYFKTQEKRKHVCLPPTEAHLIQVCGEDSREAWEALRKLASSLGEQRIYASAKAIMFSRRICYFFVRPKLKYIEICLFLNRRLQDPMVHRIQAYSKVKFAHTLRIHHSDQISEPFAMWLREAWDLAQ